MAEVSAPQIKVQSSGDSARSMSFSPPADGVIITRDGDPKASNSSDARPVSNGKGFLPSNLMRARSSIPQSNSLSNNDGRKEPTVGIDPLSKHIMERTARSGAVNTAETAVGEDSAMSTTSPSRASFEPAVNRSDSTTLINKDNKKKSSSFLSRFIAKKRDAMDIQEEDEDITDTRAEGANAETFSQPLGYMPKFPEPPKYIKVRAKGKKEKDFDRVFLAQELRGRTGVEVAQAGGRKINVLEKAKRGDAIWALEFSKDGRFLAAGGHDHIVRVWEVLATEEDRAAHEKQEDAAKDGYQTRLSAPVFKASPVQEYEGHTATVLALSWSKNNFLLSSSMDKTVRLWHTSRGECLCAFKHSDFVTSIQFHPRDDRFFLAGSLDSKLRLWSIPDKSVAHWTQLNELITAVAFTPDGKIAIAGCLSGLCIFYETEGLRQQTQMHVRSAHGKNAKGSKITGIQTITYPPSDPNGDVKLLITSNDSRVRVYNFRDKSLELKIKGLENASSQIRASFSDDARYIISGSEDKKAYIWSTGPPEKDKDKRPMEMFEAHASVVTAAIMAPARTRQLLQASGDPLFDICNPPPVQLVSRAESRSSRDPTENHFDSKSTLPTPSLDKAHKKAEDPPAWIARSAHPNGNLIVTADFGGHIKVFRQDCAYKQRLRSNDNWDTGSTFSKKMLNRSSSIATRTSRKSYRDSSSTVYPSDRILSWRQSIDRSSIKSPSLNSSHDAFPNTPKQPGFSRSISPRKSFPSSARQNSTTNPTPLSASNTPSIAAAAASFTSATNSQSPRGTKAASSTTAPAQIDSSQIQAQRAALVKGPYSNPLLLDAEGTSAALFNRAAYESMANVRQRRDSVDIDGNPVDPGHGVPTRADIDASGHLMRPDAGSRFGSASSQGSGASGMSSAGSEIEGRSGSGSGDDDGERCGKCGSENFRAKRRSGERVLECVRCGKVAE